MTDKEFQAGVSEAQQKIAKLPPGKRQVLMKLLKEVVKRHGFIKEQCSQARNGLDDLRIMLKYLVFDHEATLREQANSQGD
ncbi:MAG: hypothetical protein JXQ73_21020 [Phycisphaerae bacterium]|nr:hypothetical protein [Phycisphaerae bacterium]